MTQDRCWSLALVVLAWGCHPVAPASSPEQAPPKPLSSTIEFSADAFKSEVGSQPPNIILVTIDTLRADFLSCYGGPARTPNLDQLAQKGWLFKNCFSTSMLTNPSHASIMTSLFPKDHGVYDNQSGVQDGLPTLATAMAKRGYRTLAVISFPHLNPATSNLGQGFEHIIEAKNPQRSARESISDALGLVDKLNFGDRFFLWVHLVDPHTPYRESPSHTARGPLPVADQPMGRVRKAAPGFQKTNKWFRWAMETFKTTHPLVNRYIAEIERADAGIGQLLDGLYQRGYGSNTAYFITSDHGENLGERDLYFHHGGLYRETLHVPLIAYLPTETPAVIDELVQTIDIAPTLLRAVGARPFTPSRGRSLFDTARGKAPGRTYVFSEHMQKQMVSVRSKEATLLRHLKSGAQFPSYPMRKGSSEFYDTTTDPAERHQVLKETPVKQRLQRQLEKYLTQSYSFKPRPASTVDLSSLRALGYLD